MIEKDGLIFEGERHLLEFVEKIKDVAKDKTIPILTVDAELIKVLYRDKMEEKVFESCGVSSKLINTSNYVVSISNKR